MWVTELPQKPKAPVISERMYNPCGEIPLGPRRLSKLHLYNNGSDTPPILGTTKLS